MRSDFILAFFIFAPKSADMLDKPDKELEPEIAGPVLFALFILSLIVLLIWMAS